MSRLERHVHNAVRALAHDVAMDLLADLAPAAIAEIDEMVKPKPKTKVMPAAKKKLPYVDADFEVLK